MTTIGNLLNECIPLLMPHLPPALLADEVAPIVWDATHALVELPALRLGFECRLASETPQVDVQQCIQARSDEFSQLRKFVEVATNTVSERFHSNWQRLRKFCELWENETSGLSLSKDISEIWLEFDVVEEATRHRLPSIFLHLNEKFPPATEGFALLERVLHILTGEPISRQQRGCLQRCFVSCYDDKVINHLGIMHLRPTQAHRLIVKWHCRKPAKEQVLDFLKEVSWMGEWEEAASLMDWVSPLFDEIRLCLDVGDSVYPTLGLECFVKPYPERQAENARWSGVLDSLIERGLCTELKRDALLNWPGEITPATATSPWPARYILDSLTDDLGKFDVIGRRLNHIKLTYRPKIPLEAKGYMLVFHGKFQPLSTG